MKVGDYRVLFEVREENVYILVVLHKKDFEKEVFKYK
jgi:mRNA-degrading endonuclease RelE of RelBE toxin-antitoxin system